MTAASNLARSVSKTVTIMVLQAKTGRQQKHILSMLKEKRISVIQDDENGLYIDDFISFDDMSSIVDYLRSSGDKKKELFEKCWEQYGRKGSKKNALYQWNKLTDDDFEKIEKHVPFYIKSNDFIYLKDFERYLRHRMFECVVTDKQGNVLYDPERSSGTMGYSPVLGGKLSWNDYYKTYMYIGFYTDGDTIYDGYTGDTRPDGAEIMLNNARGTIRWSAKDKKWKKV